MTVGRASVSAYTGGHLVKKSLVKKVVAREAVATVSIL